MKGHHQPDLRPTQAHECGCELTGGVVSVNQIGTAFLAVPSQATRQHKVAQAGSSEHGQRVKLVRELGRITSKFIEATQIASTQSPTQLAGQRYDHISATAWASR
jgi:hypothetical protein